MSLIDKVQKLKFVSKDSIAVNYGIVNIGKTPAKNMLSYNCVLGNPNDISMKHYVDTLKKSIDFNSQQGFVLGANNRWEKSGGMGGIRQIDSLKIIDNEVSIVIIVVIRYYDIFNEVHYTWGCFVLDMIVTHVRETDASEKELEALALYMGHSIRCVRGRNHFIAVLWFSLHRALPIRIFIYFT